MPVLERCLGSPHMISNPRPRRVRSLMATIAVLGMAGCAAIGGGTDTEKLDRQAATFERQGKSHEAGVARKQALDLYETRLDPNSPLLADALFHTAGNYFYEAAPAQLFQHEVERAQALFVEADRML